MLLTAYLGLRSLGVGGCLLLTAYCLLATGSALAITQPPRLPQGRPERTTDYRLQTTSNAPLPTANSPLSTDSISYDRYAVIETRMPFGDESAAAALAAAAAVASQPVVESFTKVLKMCAITRNRFNGKVQVGIVNTLTKKNYFLYEGDTEDGMELVKADYESEKALVRKGAEEVWMDMTAIVSAAIPSGPAAARMPGMRIPSASQMAPGSLPGVSTGMPSPVDSGASSSQSTSEIQRRSSSRQFGHGRSRESGESAPQAGVEGAGGVVAPRPASTEGVPGVNSLMSPTTTAVPGGAAGVVRTTSAVTISSPGAAAATLSASASDTTLPNTGVRVVDHRTTSKLSSVELQRKLQEYQMNLIRSGGQLGPPLPMQLTPEMDAQLVNEGVLPSAE